MPLHSTPMASSFFPALIRMPANPRFRAMRSPRRWAGASDMARDS